VVGGELGEVQHLLSRHVQMVGGAQRLMRDQNHVRPVPGAIGEWGQRLVEKARRKVNDARPFAYDRCRKPERVPELQRGLLVEVSNREPGAFLARGKAFANLAGKPDRRRHDDLIDTGKLQSVDHMLDNRPVGDVLQSLDLDMAFPEAVTSGIFYNDYATQFHTR
jgi:hypothetical protein